MHGNTIQKISFISISISPKIYENVTIKVIANHIKIIKPPLVIY